MFGKNPVEKSNENDDNRVRVVKGSPFYTIQGEGPYMGHPAVFLRLHGCNLRCWFCDTQFSDEDDPDIDQELLGSQVASLMNHKKCNLLVITGGEPARWHLGTLIHSIRQNVVRSIIQVETAGTIWKGWMATVDLVVSPKTPKIDGRVAAKAMAFKYIVGSDTHIDTDGHFRSNTQEKRSPYQLDKPDLLAYPTNSSTPIYVSPCDEYDPAVNKLNQQHVAEIAMKYGYRVSLQMHKILDLL